MDAVILHSGDGVATNDIVVTVFNLYPFLTKHTTGYFICGDFVVPATPDLDTKPAIVNDIPRDSVLPPAVFKEDTCLGAVRNVIKTANSVTWAIVTGRAKADTIICGIVIPITPNGDDIY